MTPAERTAKIAELRAEADRLEREGKIKENAKNGDLFRSYGRIVLIPPSYPNTYALALTGESIGCQCYGWDEDPNIEYLGHARDLLTIKTPDAPEPTGAELVGKVCDFSDNGVDWTMGSLWTGKRGGDPRICTGFSPDTELRYHNANCAWKYARLYREDRP